MKILIVSQYFWPETFIINDLAKVLQQAGHEIVVATGKPNYPDGKIFPDYTVKGVQLETVDNIEVHRVPLRPRGKNSGFGLLRNYLSFVCSGLRYYPKLLRDYDFDVIFVFANSPITAAIPAIALKFIKKSHLAIWVQDLWPESLVATGYVRNRSLLSAVGMMVRGIYFCADTLLVQSKAFTAPVSRYASMDKIFYYPNSINLSGCSDENETALPEGLVDLLDSNFCVVFAGNIGKAQAIETIVSAAGYLRDLLDCKIVLVGSGSMLSWVEEGVKKLNLENLVLAGRYPAETMSQIYQRAGGLIVTLKSEEIFAYTIPSKVQAYLAAGKPIIAALNGEGARVVEEAEAGITCMAENPQALAACIRQLYGLSMEQRRRMGDAGKTYFMQHFEMTYQAEQLIDLLQERIEKSGKK